MKKLHVLVLTLAAISFALVNLNTSAQADVVYEGFDYTLQDPLAAQAGGLGWDTAWTSATTNIPYTVEAGLSLGALDVIGGSGARASRFGTASAARNISAASTAALTGNGTTAWFSVLMNPAVGLSDGFENNTHGTIVFGDTALDNNATGTTPATNAGSAVGVGFSGSNGIPAGDRDNLNYSMITAQGVTYDNGTQVLNTAQRIVVGDAAFSGNTSLFVGQIDWEANGTDDTISLYRVLDPTAALPAAFSTMTVDLDQSTFNVISMSEGQNSAFDEIRFGSSLAAVLPVSAVPEPSSFAVLGLASLAVLRRRRG